MPRLLDLDSYFVRYETRVETWEVIVGDHETWHERGCPVQPFTGPREYKVLVDGLAEAQGVYFKCPICLDHYCEASFEGRGVLPDQGTHNSEGKPVRWSVSGSGLSDLTTVPSILLIGGCNWHGYITNGEAK